MHCGSPTAWWSFFFRKVYFLINIHVRQYLKKKKWKFLKIMELKYSLSRQLTDSKAKDCLQLSIMNIPKEPEIVQRFWTDKCLSTSWTLQVRRTRSPAHITLSLRERLTWLKKSFKRFKHEYLDKKNKYVRQDSHISSLFIRVNNVSLFTLSSWNTWACYLTDLTFYSRRNGLICWLRPKVALDVYSAVVELLNCWVVCSCN